MSGLELRFLGGFEATRDGETIRSFDTDKTRALLAYLAVESARPHRRDVLAALLWPDRRDRAARTSLRQALYRLRQALDDLACTILFVTRQDIQFHASESCCLDIAHFTDLLARCRVHATGHQEPCPLCARWRQEAVALYQGDFLAGLSVPGSEAFEGWLLVRQETYHRLALDALHRLTVHHEGAKDYDQAEIFARRQIELEPWREGAHRALMRILAKAGQRSAALQQYAACRAILATELGVGPSACTTSLYRAICAGDGEE